MFLEISGSFSDSIRACIHVLMGALTFSPPTFSPSDNSTHTVGPSDNWNLELFDPHLFGPCIV